MKFQSSLVSTIVAARDFSDRYHTVTESVESVQDLERNCVV